MHSAFCKDARIWEMSWWDRCWGCSEILKQVESKVHPVIPAVGHWLVRVMNHVSGSARDARIYWRQSWGRWSWYQIRVKPAKGLQHRNLYCCRVTLSLWSVHQLCITTGVWDSAGVTPHRADWCAQRITVCMYKYKVSNQSYSTCHPQVSRFRVCVSYVWKSI